MNEHWSNLRSKDPKTVIHVEFGHFYDPEHFNLFEEFAIRKADSLGMNEVEVKVLLQKWAADMNSDL